MFKSKDFNEHYTEYPVGPIDIGTDIFLQISVTSSDAGLVVFVDECKATPTPEYYDQMQFTFLEDGLVTITSYIKHERESLTALPHREELTIRRVGEYFRRTTVLEMWSNTTQRVECLFTEEKTRKKSMLI